MAMTVAIQRSTSVAGKTFAENDTISADGQIVVEKSIPAAKSGTLTTRTDANTGVLTMASGHGITTGQTIDLYWADGKRLGMTVGTVSTNSVPIDLGAGDDLPAATTAITAMVPVVEAFVFQNPVALFFGSTNAKRGCFRLIEVGDSVVTEVFLAEKRCFQYYAGVDITGVTSDPTAAESVKEVSMSHGETTAQVMRAAVLKN